jgi:hypothetical protein
MGGIVYGSFYFFSMCVGCFIEFVGVKNV